MALDARLRKRTPPKRRDVCERRGFDPAQHAIRDSDIGDLDCTAMQSPGKKKVPGLASEKRNREFRIDCAAHYRASRTVHATWQIDGHNGCRSGIHQTDDVAGRALNIPVEPRAKQRIDDQVTFGKRYWRWLTYESAPAICRHSGVTFQALAFPDKANACRQTPIGQIARGNETIAAVVTGTCNDHDATPLQHPAGGFSNSAARILHELDAGDAAGNGQAVSLCHLSRREQFDHLPARVPVRPTTNNSRQPIAPEEVLRGWLNSNHFA
jgi:hypothetical protein